MPVERRVAVAWAALMLFTATGPARADEKDEGKRVYGERCAPCHGDTGNGDGPAAAALTPRPRNFRDATFWQGRSHADVVAVVKKGKPGTDMAPFEGVLSNAEIEAVAAFVERFRPGTGDRSDRGDGALPDPRSGQAPACKDDRSRCRM